MGKLLFVGNLTLDNIIYADGRTKLGVIGGNSLYAAIGARMWGRDVAIASVTGHNWPTEFTQSLQSQGIDTSYLQSVDADNPQAWILYEEDGQRAYVPRNAELLSLRPDIYNNATLSPESLARFGKAVHDLHLRMSPVPGVVLGDDVSALHICPMRLETMSTWSDYLSQYPKIFATADMFPVSLQTENVLLDLAALLSTLDVFLPSVKEARLLQKTDGDLDELCLDLASYGPRNIIVKDGKNGAHIFDRDTNKLQHVPVFPSSTVDSTGAGDAFCGGFVAGMTMIGDPLEAVFWGTISASFIVEDYGGLHGLTVTPERAKRRLKTLKSSVNK